MAAQHLKNDEFAKDCRERLARGGRPGFSCASIGIIAKTHRARKAKAVRTALYSVSRLQRGLARPLFSIRSGRAHRYLIPNICD